MSEDPEITDPRDPYRRPDIVTELDRWLVSRASLREATVSHALLQGARDEIVALREIAARPSSELHALTKERDELREMVERQRFVLSKGHAETRADALEEAAQVCIRLVRGFPQCGIAASAIRKLKDKGHG